MKVVKANDLGGERRLGWGAYIGRTATAASDHCRSSNQRHGTDSEKILLHVSNSVSFQIDPTRVL